MKTSMLPLARSSVSVALALAVSMPLAAWAAPPEAMSPGPSEPAGKNLLRNGAFEGELLRPWSLSFGSSRNGRRAPGAGELCVRIDDPGKNPYDVRLRQGPLLLEKGHRYQVRLKTHATGPTRLQVRASTSGTPPADHFSAVMASGPQAATYTATFVSPVDDDKGEIIIDMGGPLAGAARLSVCVDDVEVNDPQFEVPAERVSPPLPKVRVNQVGYLPGWAKRATVLSAATAPLEWRLVDAAGKTRATGATRPFGADRASGDSVHLIDFSLVTATGSGWKLVVGGDESFPFAIDAGVYRRLKYDALSFFYLQRSGVPIEMPFAGSKAYARPAGHPGDKSVPCAPEAPCRYALDASGGWYDAGDHGKYIVSSAISVWTLHNQYEALARFGATASDFADGKMKIPESHNGRPDLLDEARFNLDFMLRLQVPAGQPLAGMAHHKIHGQRWTAIPTAPDRDDVKRYVRPPSTVATLDLAATAAQAARIWRALDPPFAARCLTAAETAFAAARKNSVIHAERPGEGGGAYGDGDISDHIYWAAAELFITTGKPAYGDEMLRSPHHQSTSIEATGGTLGWDHVAAMGKISLGTAPSTLGADAVDKQRRAIAGAADRFLAAIGQRGYGAPLPSETAYNWGSNAGVLNAALVLGAAYLFSRDVRYANGAIECLDYLLGRNPLALSYVAGHGARAIRNPHHRVWAHQKDASLPEAPPGAVAGGPNSMLQDPYIRKVGMAGCPPQTCYVDNIDSYSTNEVAINWNAPLAWTAAFLDDLGHRPAGR